MTAQRWKKNKQTIKQAIKGRKKKTKAYKIKLNNRNRSYHKLN